MNQIKKVTNVIGEFCVPSMLGYDLTCRALSEEARGRIVKMFDNIKDIYKEKSDFLCFTDHKRDELGEFYIKICYQNKFKAEYLIHLLKENGCVINEDLISQTQNLKTDFVNYWKYQVKKNIWGFLDMEFMQKILDFDKMTPDERNKAFNETMPKINYLDMFEKFGIYNQIELELERGNLGNAVLLARHSVDNHFTHYNQELELQIDEANGDLINCFRNCYNYELARALNIHYHDNNQPNMVINDGPTIDYWTNKDIAYVSNEVRDELETAFESLTPHFKKCINMNVLRLLTKNTEDKTAMEKDEEKELLHEYNNLVPMFSFFGLYLQVSREIDNGNYSNAMMAIKHVADQLISPLFMELQKQGSDNNLYILDYQPLYCLLKNIETRYYVTLHDAVPKIKVK